MTRHLEGDVCLVYRTLHKYSIFIFPPQSFEEDYFGDCFIISFPSRLLGEEGEGEPVGVQEAWGGVGIGGVRQMGAVITHMYKDTKTTGPTALRANLNV